MRAKLFSAWGYQGDAMNLPVASVTAANYYVEKMGFAIVGENGEPHKKVILERDGIQLAIAENGGDPEQAGCAFHTNDVAALRNEFVANGLEKIGELTDDSQGGKKFKVFFVVAPDGLCYWFGEEQPTA